MNEIVKSMHLVKMYVWERPFQFKVERVRRYDAFVLMNIFWFLIIYLDEKLIMLFVNHW
jgi:hypothetical protein